MKKILLLTSVLLILFSACKEDVESEVSASLTVFAFDDMPGEQVFEVRSNTNWTISGAASDWCTFNPSSGKGNTPVKVLVADNATEEQRILTLSLGAAGTRSVALTVVQEGYPATVIPLGTRDTTIAHTAQRLQIPIKTNTDNVSVTCVTESGETWIRRSALNKSSATDVTEMINFEVDANTLKTGRVARIFIEAGGDSHIIRITQQGEPDMIQVAQDNFILPSRSTVICLRLRTNTNVVVEEDSRPDWITMIPKPSGVERAEMNDKDIYLRITQWTDETKGRTDSLFLKDAAGKLSKVKITITQGKVTLREKDSLALLKIYDALHENGEWRGSDGGLVWDPEKPIDTWLGVYLKDGRVDSITTSKLKIGATYLTAGVFPTAAFAELTAMRALRMNPATAVRGVIGPEFGKLKNLESLSLGEMAITELQVEWKELTSLRTLNLARMNLLKARAGSTQRLLVPEMGDMPNLRDLQFGGMVGYSDTIPAEWGPKFAVHGKLEKIVLERNGFTGKVPASLGDIKSLKEIHIIQNSSLGGSIPPELFSLPRLCTLRLNSNRFSGDIPEDIGSLLPEGNQLKIITLGHNIITGSIPQSLKDHYMWRYWYRDNGIFPLCTGIPGCGNVPGAFWFGGEADRYASANLDTIPAVWMEFVRTEANESIGWQVEFEGEPDWVYFKGTDGVKKWEMSGGNSINTQLPVVFEKNTTTESRSAILKLTGTINGVAMKYTYPLKLIQRAAHK